MAREWTKSQREAIEADGGPLLVTAAAGSGKTAVLTEHILRLITEKGIDADRLLVLTFTRAAASEMRNRIFAKLTERQTAEPNNRALLRQQMLLARANISTVDSFCSDLVREHFRSLGVENDYRLIEETEYRLFQDEVLRELLEKKYEEREEGFLLLSELFSGERNNDGFRRTILRLYGFLSTYADREAWLSSLDENADNADTNGNVWKQIKLAQLEKPTTYHLRRLKTALDKMPDDPPFLLKNRALLEAERNRLLAIKQAIESRDWTALEACLLSAEFDRWASKPGYFDPTVEECKEIRAEAKSFVVGVKGFFTQFDASRIRRDNGELRPVLHALTALLRELIEALDEAKREANVLAFEDLERLALCLLTERDEAGNFRPSREARDIAKRYDAVFVDEYQDTNYIQSLLYDMLSDGGKNLFMVGDIKQSIYAFRSAVPEIFEHKKRAYPLYNEEAPSFPARIALSANFRSRPGITDFVNFVFRRFCTEDLGGTTYDENEELIAKGVFPEKNEAAPDVELHLYEGNTAEENRTATATYTANRIVALMNEGTTVTENGEERPLRFGDIAILCRSPKKAARELNEAFSAAGIPLSVDNADENFFCKREIRLALALLRVLLNPYDDVSLAATMLNPVFGFTPDDLAGFCTKNRSLPLYEAVKDAENERVTQFLSTIETLRRAAGERPADELLLTLYEMTALPAVLSACGEETASENLDALVGYAAAYRKNGNGDLASFLRYIDRLQENGMDLSSAGKTSADAVRLMSIHKSKGLEFPVVILPNFGGINKTALHTAQSFTHPKYGFASRIRRDGIRSTTLPFCVMKDVLEKEQLSEELRVLYVAMTRAVDRLIFIDVRKDPLSVPPAIQDAAHDPALLSTLAGEAGDIHQWILWAAFLHRDGASLCKQRGIPPLFDETEAVEPLLVVYHESGEEPVTRNEQTAPSSEPLPPFDPSVFDRAYPYEAETRLPTKVSASSLSHGFFRQNASEIRPLFAQKNKTLSASEAGTATHLFMSLLDLLSDRPLTESRDSLVQSGKLTAEQASAIRLAACETFLSSPLGKRVKEAAKRNDLLREYAFSFRKKASELGLPAETDACVMVSGVADLIFFEEGKTVIVDYKTDRVASSDELKERYASQLSLYDEAANALWEGRTVERFLWSFTLDTAVEL